MITLPRLLAKKRTEDRAVVGEVEAHVSTCLTGGELLNPELFGESALHCKRGLMWQ